MLPGVAFILYLAVGCILIFMFLLLCVRISVFIEDTCPIRFCLRRKQRKLRKILIRDMLFPDDPLSPRPAPPSDENITADIICQPYIYRDAYSTGLTQLSGLSLLANLPLTVACDGNPSDAVVTNCNSDQMRLALFRRIRPQALTEGVTSPSTNRNHTNSEITEDTIPEDNDDDEIIDTREDDEDDDAAAETTSLPPDYANATTNMSSIILKIDNETDSINSNYEQPPPSYYECVNFDSSNYLEENGNLLPDV